MGQIEHGHYENRLTLGSMLRAQVRVVELARDQAGGKLIYEHAPRYPGEITADLKAGLQKALGGHWEVEKRASGGAPTLLEAEEARKAKAEAQLRASPLVSAALAAFPQAQFVEEERAGGGHRSRPSAASGGFRG